MPDIILDENAAQLINSDELKGEPNNASPTMATIPPPFIITDPNHHTMQASLLPYIKQKIHQDLLLPSDDNPYPWKEILVRPLYSRPPHSRRADCEKREKRFNWHRPTTTIIGPDRIALNCFPGMDYTEHYASLVASYLALSGQDASIVKCIRPPADGRMCKSLFEHSNLRDLGQVDVVILGYVYYLEVLGYEDGEWETGTAGSVREINEGEGTEERVMFSWRIRGLPGGKTAAYLACMPSFWGDISYHLVQALHKFNKPECVVYLGKAGALSEAITPNGYLVTGNEAYLDHQQIQWENILEPEYYVNELGNKEVLPICTGPMVTVSSPLCESFQWLKENYRKAEWVDCEVGHMARACTETGTRFGYLHIISDNVSGNSHKENLANEHEGKVRVKRRRLFDEVQRKLDSFLNRYGRGEDAVNTV